MKTNFYPRKAEDALQHDVIIDNYYDIFDTLQAPSLDELMKTIQDKPADAADDEKKEE